MKKAIVVIFFLIVLGTLNSVFAVEENTKNTKDQTQRSEARVNPTSLGMELSIPLGTMPGRAGNAVPITFNYSSKVWRSDPYPVTEDGHTVYYAYPYYSDDSNSGWTSGLRTPWVEDTTLYYYSATNSSTHPLTCTGNVTRLPKLTVHMVDGSTVDLISSFTSSTYLLCSSQTDPTTYFSYDGSNLKYVITSGQTPNATLYLPDGGRYQWNDNTSYAWRVRYIDRHGNITSLNWNSTTSKFEWADTMGRVIPLLPGIPQSGGGPAAGDMTYDVPSMAGEDPMEWTFKWKKLEDSFGNLNGTYQKLTLGHLFSECWASISMSYHNPVVLNEIVQPDGRSYKFYYNEYGEIEKIIYPTGAIEKFTYEYVAPFSFGTRGSRMARAGNRGVVDRVLSPDGNTATDMHWEYEVPTTTSGGAASSPYTVRTINPDGTKHERLLFSEMNPNVLGQSEVAVPYIMSGKEYESRFYDSNNNIVRRELTAWSASSYGATDTSWLNAYPKVDRKVSVVIEGSSALAQAQTFTYDTYLNLASMTEYDFTIPTTLTDARNDLIGEFSNGTALRTSQTTYKTDANYITRQLLSLPISTVIRNGGISGSIVAKTEMVYDESTYGLSSSGTMPTAASASWLDPVTELGSTLGAVRGNVTSVKSYYDISNSYYIETHTFLDQFGNVRKVRDGRGNDTETLYDDDYAFAYPTNVVTPVPDSTGTNGSSTAFTSTTAYDFNTGLPTSTTDANGQITEMEYEDPMLRPTKVIAPNDAETITEYGAGTGPSTNWVKVKTQIDATTWKEAITWTDGIGRTILTQSVDAATDDVFVAMCYDDAGRIAKTSNPVRSSSAPACSSSLEWTIPTYDDLGRTTVVTTPDSAHVDTAFSLATTGSQIGPVTSVTDQAGKLRRSITNALGQLIRVDEPDDSSSTGSLGAINSPNQATVYAYDLLNNLTTVTQGAQTRSFTYDAISRLKSATNPESGTINYTYDANGNLATKVDARSITTTYTYDRLNRVTLRGYTNEPSGSETADVSYFYDNRTNAKGKLIKVQSSVSTTEYTAFDIMGRVTSSKQTTDGVTYGNGTTDSAMTYTYNLGGALIEQTYPSGRKVQNELDVNGDLSVVQSKKNTTSGPFHKYAFNFVYNAAGAVTSMELGNLRYESTAFNSRLQPTQIALGTTQGGTNLLDLDFTYGTTANNGNVLTQTINVPTVGANTGFAAVQTYTYDSLNRLKDATENVTPIGGSATQTWKQTFTYDRYGNRRFDFSSGNTTTPESTCSEATCNPTVSTTNNRINSNGYSFDSGGNTIADAAGRTFVYDAENKQVEIKNSSNQTIGHYFYDGDGRRVKKTAANGETVIFVYDAIGKVIAEYALGVSQTPEVSYLTSDQLDSPRIVTNKNGSVLSRRDFHPFGEQITRTAYGSDSVRERFASYERDDESGLDFAQARYYSPNLGRFFSVDPENADADEEVPQSWNAYSYARNNPLKYGDPSGEGVEVCSTSGERQCVYYTEKQWTAFLEANKKGGEYSIKGNKIFLGEELTAVITSSSFLNENQMEFVQSVADESITKSKVVGVAAGAAVLTGACIGTGTCAAVGTAIVVGTKALIKGSLRYSPKISRQLAKRGWTKQQVESTIKNPHATAKTTYKGTGESATAYVNKDGSYVVVKNATNEIIQVSDKTRAWDFPKDWVWK